MLDLDRGVEGQVRVPAVDGCHDATGVVGGVEEVGVGEADVTGPGGHQLVHVGEHRGLLDGADPPVVDHRHRAVAAAVSATAAGGDGADQSLLAGDGQAGVALQRRQQLADRHSTLGAVQLDGGSWVCAVRPCNQAGLVLAGDDRVRRRRHGEVSTHPCVQAEETHRQARPTGPDGLDDPQRQSHGRVHRH